MTELASARLPLSGLAIRADTHFVQQGDGPVFIGPGRGTLDCGCGNTLIRGYDPARFLAIGIGCGQCGQLTTTPRLPDGVSPPFAVIVAEPLAEGRSATTNMPAHVFVVGRAEMDRISGLYQPVTPPGNEYRMSPALLDEAIAAHARHTGHALPSRVTDAANPYVGLRDHALGWAIQHLRGLIQRDLWACLDGVATPIAVAHVAGFLHFVATWSHHPLFPAMVVGAAARGFSMHGLAPFATAHCATMLGNRISFLVPTGAPARVDSFNLATGPTDIVAVHLDVFDRFEVPFGQAWNQASLRSAVADRIAAAQGHINLRNPGMVVLSPGTALAGYDEALIEAVRHALQTQGRKNRGLMAVAPIVLRLQATSDPHAVRFGYGFFPAANPHYAGDSLLQMNG